MAGDGKASNFAAGTADRFPAWGTSQIAVLPATSPNTYPNKPLGWNTGKHACNMLLPACVFFPFFMISSDFSKNSVCFQASQYVRPLIFRFLTKAFHTIWEFAPRNPCASKAAATIDTLSAKLKATTRTMCGSAPTSTGFDTRPGWRTQAVSSHDVFSWDVVMSCEMCPSSFGFSMFFLEVVLHKIRDV